MPRWTTRPGPLVPPILSVWGSWPYVTNYWHTNTEASNGLTLGAANTAYYYPITVLYPCRITKFYVLNGSPVSGNLDLGLYTEDGNRLISTGSTVQTGAVARQLIDVTDTDIPPGLLYLAAASTSTATLFFAATSSAFNGYAWGVKQQAVYPLPATATFAFVNAVIIPAFGALVAPRTLV